MQGIITELQFNEIGNYAIYYLNKLAINAY